MLKVPNEIPGLNFRFMYPLTCKLYVVLSTICSLAMLLVEIAPELFWSWDAAHHLLAKVFMSMHACRQPFADEDDTILSLHRGGPECY